MSIKNFHPVSAIGGQDSYTQGSTAQELSDATLSDTALGAGSDTAVGADASGSPPPPETVTFAGSGLVFNNTYGSGVSSTFRNEIVAAEQYLESQFTNSCTVNCNFDLQALNHSFSAENFFNPVHVTYSQFVNALAAHAGNAESQAAVAALQHLSDPSNGAGFDVSIGEAQILGLAGADSATDDNVILNNFYWTATALQNSPGDAQAVIEHELTEGIMGRIGSLGLTGSSSWAPMDLFRFTASGQRDFSGGRDGLPTFFSADGTNINTGLQFHNSISSSGQFDGFDLADFDGVGQDANDTDPFGPGGPGVGDPGTLSATDIQILEALGWNPLNASNPPAPAGTTADMIMFSASSGNYEIFNIGQNRTLNGAPLVQIGSPWTTVGLGNFSGADAADMMLRNGSTGALQIEDVSNNNVIGSASIGQVGLEWSVAGFGDFSSSANESDMLMRNNNTGAFTLFDISNNQIVGAVSNFGQVGLEWSIAGFGDFSGNPNETDLLMRNSSGVFTIFDISHNRITGNFANIGQVGLEWSVAGFGDFNGSPNETDMLMRNNNTGAFVLFDISNNKITSINANFGQVGLEWSVAGFGDFSGNPNETDMLMRNKNTGAFCLFDIANNRITSINANFGQVGLEWSIAGIANDPSGTASTVAGSAHSETAGMGSSPQPIPTNTNSPGQGGILDTESRPFSQASDFFNQAIAGFAPSAPTVGGGAAVTEMGTGSLAPATAALGCVTGNSALSVSEHNPASSQT